MTDPAPTDSNVANDPDARHHLIEAIRLAMGNVRDRRTWPFGAVLTRDGDRIATAVNEIDALCDPSAHAEMQVIRAAARKLKSTDLAGCTVYASGYPCAMCLSAMYLAGIRQVWYAYSNDDGAPYGLSAERGYRELALPPAARELTIRSLAARDDGDEDLYEAWHKVSERR